MNETAPCTNCGTPKWPGEWCSPCIESGRSDLLIIETAIRDAEYQRIMHGDTSDLARRVHEKLQFFGRLPRLT